ncbi:hypothetical protein FSP39_002718 [Pinctada imbricata]|uniref:Tr-type G domain-containing protein n=1 Tax=Pinctada imbricata TaxID=66713 RepID=A0AA89BPL8_PINIB|nr:hypothetical protein FSP39_002718 [Pinctada imbricata]
MARHRNVRTMNYEDEYYDEDDVYGHSVEDNYCISPATAAQFTFNRDHHVNLSNYMEEGIPEEEEGSEGEHDPLSDSGSGRRHLNLTEMEEGQLNSCLEEVRNVLGETVPEQVMIQTIINHKYSIEKSLNELLSLQDAPKPQRQPRQNRRNRSQEFAPNPPTVQLKTPVKKTSAPEVINFSTNSTSSPTVDSSKRQPVIGFTPVKNDITNKTKESNPRTQNSQKQEPVSAENKSDVPDASSELCSNNVEVSRKESLQETTLSTQTPKKESVGGATPKSTSKSKQDKAKLKEEFEKRQSGKDLLNLVVIGHVDAGKSTLMGHMLYQLGVVNKKAMHKYEQESRKLGKGSFAFAWVLDETEEERSRGVTMDIAQTHFQTPKKHITLLDAPGHKDFIPNMITGTAQADVAILVVNATRGEFETGFESGGQTREHAVLARSLGVAQLIVAVNKMDTVDWSDKRYDEITKKLGQFLKQVGYRDTDISFVPCSGLNGENLVKPISEPKLSSWYKGSTLAEQIDKFKPVTRQMDKPFRLSVSDVFKGMGSGFSIVGRVASGSVQAGDRLQVMPSGDVASVKNVLLEDSDGTCGFAGDHVTLTLTGMDMAHVNVGSVLCDPNEPIKCATRIRARVVIFNIEVPITKGYMVEFHYQAITEPAVIKRLKSQLNKTSGEVVKNRPKCIVKNSSAVIEIEFERPICLELYKDYKDLGRFMLRSSGHTIAAGLVEEVLKTKSKTEEDSSEKD